MSYPRKCTFPNFADTSPIHQAALANREEHLWSWQCNVEDHLKSKTTEEIKQYVKDNSLPFAVLMENWLSEFNMSSVFRNGNALGAKEMFYLGDKRYDKRGAVGVFNYSEITWLSTIDDLLKLKSKYRFVGVDNIKDAQPLSSYTWKDNSLMIFGSEGVGLTPTIQSYCDDMIYIKQRGSVRSLNAAVASGIIMNHFATQYESFYNEI